MVERSLSMREVRGSMPLSSNFSFSSVSSYSISLFLFVMSEEFDLTVFGAGQSIGKSCFLLSVHGIYILLDCGCYVGRDNKKALPDLSKLPHDITVNDISAVLISHFHMDHVGGLVYLTEELGYKGDIYVSGPTRAILPIVFKNTRTLISTQMQLQTPAPVELFADLVKRLKDVSVNEAIHISIACYCISL